MIIWHGKYLQGVLYAYTAELYAMRRIIATIGSFCVQSTTSYIQI